LVTGWASIMVAIFFIGGSILTVLGIIGIYLGRVFEEVKSRPLYIIESTTTIKEFEV
jgi:dolichol-phosphate mannosyltransferase